MRARRVITLSVALVVALVACYAVFVTQPFAQGPPPGMGPEAGMGGMGGMPGAPGQMGMPGMGGGPGGGGGGGGNPWTWSESAMPEELTMSYGEFLMQEGQAPVPLPEFYLIKGNGDLKKHTRNEWFGLSRLYEDRPVKLAAPLVGRPGNQLWDKIYVEAAVKHNEVNAIWYRWVDALSNFWFEVGYPYVGPQMLQFDWQRKSLRSADGTIGWKRWEATLPETFSVVVPVVMHVKDKCQQTYGNKFYRAMKPFDNRGWGRAPFEFMTYEDGFLRPHTFYLADETIQVWNNLWERADVQLRLFDPENVEIVRASQPSGLSPSIFTQMVNPPTIYYDERYRLLFGHEDEKFRGGSKLNLNGKEGWYFEYTFTLTRDQLKALNSAKARLVVDGGPPERMKYLAAPALGGATQQAGGATPMGGGMPGGGMPGAPGGPGAGMEGMGPPM